MEFRLLLCGLTTKRTEQSKYDFAIFLFPGDFDNNPFVLRISAQCVLPGRRHIIGAESRH